MNHARHVSALVLLALLASIAAPCGAQDAPSHADVITQWRSERVARLESDTGWLTVAGFAWLQPGENIIGSGEDAVVKLPADVAPAVAGVLDLNGETGEITLRVEPGVSVEIEKVLVREKVLPRDENMNSPVMSLGRVSFWVMERGGEAAVRMRDPECHLRGEFTRIDYYGIDPVYRVEATTDPADGFSELVMANVMGYEDVTTTRPVYFTLGGEDHILFPSLNDDADSTYFFVLADETTGLETYGGGRFLYADLQPDGSMVLDFNKAYNPPCAFNPWTTCSLPPEQNILSIAVRAGEKKYTGESAHE